MPSPAAAIDALKELLGARANDAASVREHHSHGESYHAPAAPDVVCFPRSTDEVAAMSAGSAIFWKYVRCASVRVKNTPSTTNRRPATQAVPVVA